MELLVGQAKNDDTPFFFEDWSIKKEKGLEGGRKQRIGRSSVIVICGHTRARQPA